jgi:transposase
MGKSIRQIARDAGVSRNTVRKYLRAEGLPERKERPKRGSKLDPFKPALDQMMAGGIYNAEVLWERIREQGYSGGKTLVKDYVKPHRPPRQAPAVQRYETKPGDQAQVDWGIADYVDEQGCVSQSACLCDDAGLLPGDIHRVHKAVRHPELHTLFDQRD